MNIAGLQTQIPLGYESPDAFSCYPKSHMLIITELLPNPAGDDNNNEFVEVYNPTSYPVDLSGYTVQIGNNFDKSYVLASLVLQPGGYAALTNQGVGFALVNTQSRARLIAPAGNIVSETPLYTNPPDGQSWALIDSIWQYTNQPTPAVANMLSLIGTEDDTVSASAPSPCPAGKYRNPLTNRCRSIESDASVLASCDSDQYRSPETGRCRKITLAGAVAPCKDGQYRSEETNRCRNLPATSVPSAAFAVQPVKETGLAFVGWWALGGVSLLAVGYAAWEWRHEVASIWQRAIGRFGSK